MTTCNIDIETYCDIDLKYAGVHKYAAHSSFEILMIGYSIDYGPVIQIDLANNDEIPSEFISLLTNPNIKKTAWNANFELACLNRYNEFETPANQWECTMAKACMLNLPASLDMAGQVIGTADKKSATGKALIKFFSMPNKGVRRLPKQYPDKYKAYLEYNIFDVKVEQQIAKEIEWFTVIDREREIWLLDHKINTKGIKLDRQFVRQALKIKDIIDERLMTEAKELSGLDNPNSLTQLKAWVEQETGSKIASLTKESIINLIEEYTEPNVNRVLCIRQQMAKSSNNKYVSMAKCMMADDRARGLHQYMGAAKTGRWAGRLIQPQNLTHTKFASKELIDIARNHLLLGDIDAMDVLYDNVSLTLSKLIRTAFIPDEGHELLISDFSAIEAVITAWFASEKWRLDVFGPDGDGKIYEASGAKMFKVPTEQVKGDIRAKAKVAELALGFQGGYNAMITMGALKMGIPEEEIAGIVSAWRRESPNIVKLWYAVDKAAIEAVDNPGKIISIPKLKFQVKHNILFIQLPSSRCLSYQRPFLKQNKFDRVAVGYEGLHQITNKWCKQETYGGKLVENIVQGTARDVLADAMIRLDKAGVPLVMHVHDEIVGSVPKNSQMPKIVGEIMSQEIPWAIGMPLRAATFTSPYYIKD